MAQEDGTVILAAARPGQTPQEIVRVDSLQVDAAQSAADATFLQHKGKAVGKPAQSGVLLPVSDPYLEAGEILYVGLIADATDAIVSANCTVNISVARKTAAGVSTLKYTVAKRHTDDATGGIPDDGTANQSQPTYLMAFPPVPAGAMDKLHGFLQVIFVDV